MEFAADFLTSKLKDDGGISPELGKQLLDLIPKFKVKEEGGPHRSLCGNFDSYLPELIELMETIYQVTYVDHVTDEAHKFRLRNVRFVRSKESPTHALLHGDYVARFCGTLVYERRTKPECVEVEMDLDEKDETGEDDGEDEGLVMMEVEDDISSSENIFRFVKREYASEYTEVQETHEKFIDNISTFPIPVRTALCNLRVGRGRLDDYMASYLKHFVFIVSTILKATPYEETALNHIPLSFSFHSNKKKIDMVEHRSAFVNPDKKHRTNCTLKIRLKEKKNAPLEFRFDVPHENTTLPLMVLVLGYGGTPERFLQYVSLFLGPEFLAFPIVEMLLQMLLVNTSGLTSQRQALLHMASVLSTSKNYISDEDKCSYTVYMLSEEILPHCNEIREGRSVGEDDRSLSLSVRNTNLRKLFTIAEVVAELIRTCSYVRNWIPENEYPGTPMNVRCLRYKTLVTPGYLMADLLRRHIKIMNNHARLVLTKSESSVNPDLFFTFKTDKKLVSAIRNGNFNTGIQQNDTRLNVTFQVHTDHEDSVGCQTSKVLRNGSGGKNLPSFSKIADTNDSNGLYDPYQTSQSDKCMKIRFMAYGACLSPLINLYQASRCVEQMLEECGTAFGFTPFQTLISEQESDRLRTYRDRIKVWSPLGWLLGTIEFPERLYREFVRRRRLRLFSRYLSFHYEAAKRTVRFIGEPGRLLSPLIIMEEALHLFAFLQSGLALSMARPYSYLERRGWIEYLDAGESFSGMVYRAESWEDSIRHDFIYTHMVLHPSLWFTDLMNDKWLNHNKDFRRLTNAELKNRRIGFQPYRVDGCNVSVSLISPQFNLFSDPLSEELNTNYGGAMCNLMIWGTHNMEEGLQVKKQFIERGACATVESQPEQFVVPDDTTIAHPLMDNQCTGLKPPHLYRHLKPNGLPDIGTRVERGDVIIGAMSTSKDGVKRCTSRIVTGDESYYVVEDIDVGMNSSGNGSIHVVRVWMKSGIHNLSIGDKVFFSGGQKCTVAYVISEEDLPFSINTGITPDAIAGSTIIARMTQSLLLEMMFSKAYALNPTPFLGQLQTVFQSPASMKARVRFCKRILHAAGYRSNGKEVFIDGRTGVTIRGEIMTGFAQMNVSIMRSAQKAHARGFFGKVDPITQQSVQGRKNQGGFKGSELAFQSILSFGAAEIHKNLICENAAPAIIYYCTQCQSEAIGNDEKEFYYCHRCNTSEFVGYLYLPHVAHLNKQELQSIGLQLRFHTSIDTVEQEVCTFDEVKHQLSPGDRVQLSYPALEQLKRERGIVIKPGELLILLGFTSSGHIALQSPRGSTLDFKLHDRVVLRVIPTTRRRRPYVT